MCVAYTTCTMTKSHDKNNHAKIIMQVLVIFFFYLHQAQKKHDRM